MLTETNPMVQSTHTNGFNLYKAAGAAALAIMLIGLLDVMVTFLPGGVCPDPGQGTAAEWFAYYQESWFLGLRGQGLWNIFNMSLGVLIMAALYYAHRPSWHTPAAIAATIYLAGMVIYMSNNIALPMLVLSGKYAAATNGAERNLLLAAGEALLARGEDFTPGSFWGFFLNQVSYIVMSLVMLRSGIFSKTVSYTGLAGFAAMLAFIIWAVFIPVLYSVAMVLAMIAGLLNMAWMIMMARSFFQLGRLGR